jgi:uncharacterized protein (DUF1501 family)
MPRHCHCEDFSRAQMLKRAAGRAGSALPVAPRAALRDPLSPTPAGSGLDRRQFLLRSAGLMLTVYGASLLDVGAFEEGIAAAAGPGDKVLVSVFMAGGVDSLSVLAPIGDPGYRKLRPKLALSESEGTPFAEDPRLHWHPSASALAALHSEGKVSVMPAIGYDHPDQSHFSSRHFYEVGALDPRLVTGWLGRFLDRTGSPDNPLQGLSLDGELAAALATTRMPVAAVSTPGDYDFWAPGVWGEVEDWMLESFPALGSAHASSHDKALRAAGTVAAQSGRLRQQLAPFAGERLTSPVTYPADDSGFASSLGAIAAMLAAGLPLRCVALTAPGEYDTHDSQPQDLAEGLKSTADCLLAFQRDLEARGLADRVLVQVWSEFGRRAEENGSDGTDHGAAGLGLLLGTRARGQAIGEFPGLDRLDEDGNLRATSDFRAIYCSLLEQWFGTDAAALVPDASRFGRPALVK